MTLELTKIEYLRLQNQMASMRCRAASQSIVDTEKEQKIVEAIRENYSSKTIKKMYHTSDRVIVRIRKEYGFWGA